MTSSNYIGMCVFIVLLVLPLVTPYHSNEAKCTCDFTRQSSTLNLNCDSKPSHEEISKCFLKYNTSRELVFTDSFLTEIPVEINILQQLTNLDLSRNDLHVLDLGQIEPVCNILVKLSVAYNNIHVLEKGSMDCLKALTTFSIANNSLSVIENGTFNDNMKRLEYIYVMHNNLTSLDSSVVYLPNLKTHGNVLINATWNYIGIMTNAINISITDISLNESFGLVMTHNNFTSINIEYYFKLFHVSNPSLLYRLGNSGFDVRFNPFICDCAMEPVAEALRKFRWMDPDNPVFSITCHDPNDLSGMMIYKVPLNEFNCSIYPQCPEGCSCIETVSVKLITVTCANKFTSSTLPDHVPRLENIHINIKSGTLTRLSSRHYLTNTTVLDVSGCAVDTISNDLLKQMAKIETVHLHDNSLITMPNGIEHIPFDGLRTLTLRGNPFTCDCHSLWFKKWLIRNKLFVSDVTRVLCATGPGKGNPIIGVSDSDFKCVYSITTNELLAIVFSVVFLMILILLLIHFNRTRIQVLLIAYFNIYCFRRKATGDFPYDVFISHSSKDDDWVINTLMAKLESQQPPYKIFFDERDFQPGKTIVYNVIHAIQSSRTTLLVLTNNFLRSDWCMMEFKEAHLNMLTDGVNNFIVIVMEELDESLMGEELRFYLRTNVYINYADKLFWPKLLQALPMAHTPSVSNSSGDTVSERSPLLVN